MSPKSLKYTDKDGTHTYNGTAKAGTWGTDPGWFGMPEDSTFQAGTDCEATIENADGKHWVYADSNASLEYYVDLEGGMELPGDIMNVIRHNGSLSVPLTITFRGLAQVDGTTGIIPNSEAWSMAKLIGTDGETIYRNECTATPGTPQAQFEDTVQAEIRFIPILNLSRGHIYIVLQASTTAILQLDKGGGGTLTCTALTDPQIQFNQGAFEQELASLGIPSFNLTDYFTLNCHDPVGFHTPMTISTPDLAAASDTGPSDTDNVTGDHTPTFTGTVTDPFGYAYSTPSFQLPPGIQLPPGVNLPSMPSFSQLKAPTLVVLYVDGVVAGRGTLTNPRYDVNTGATTFDYTITASPLSDGGHAIMVAAGSSDSSLTAPSDPLTVTIDGSIPLGEAATLTLGAGGAKSITYTDADGTTATIKLSSGSADVTFEGDGLGRLDTTSGITVTGGNICPAAIDISGDTAKATLSFALKNAAGSDKQISIGSITSDNGLKSISGKGVNVWGDIRVYGPLQSLTLNNFSGPHAIVLDGHDTDPAASLTFRSVSDASLTCGIPIKSLAAVEWADADGVADAISAPSIAALIITGAKAGGGLPALAGDFRASLTLTGGSAKATLGSASIAGGLKGASWGITGDMGNLTVGGLAGGWNAGEELTVSASGSMGAITLGAAIRADFLAGVDASLGGDAGITRRADDALDFKNAGAAIKSVTIKGMGVVKGTPPGNYFADSNFSAAKIGAASIVDAVFNNDQAGLDDTQDDFGFWALTMKSVKHKNLAAPKDPATNWPWTPKLPVPLVADDLNLAPII